MDTAFPIVPRRIVLLLVAPALVGCLAGCGRPVADVPRPATLRGRVIRRGKPLVGAMVYAVSETAPAAAPAAAQTGKDGAYVMESVPGGRVRIAVVPGQPADAASGPACDPKYADWRSSGLSVDATAGAVTYDIAVE